MIAKSVLEKISGGDKLHISNSAVKLLQQQTFPGNVRELRNLLERALIFKQSNVIDDSVINRCLNGLPQILKPRIEQLDIDLKTLEYNHLRKLMSAHQGDKDKVSVRSLYRKLAEE